MAFEAEPAEPAGLLVLSQEEACALRPLRGEAAGGPKVVEGRFCVDMGLRELQVLTVVREGIVDPGAALEGLDGADAHVCVTWAELDEICAAKKDAAWECEPGYAPAPVEIFSEETKRHAKLLPVAGGCPTAVLAGFNMHRMKDTDPVRDTAEKVRALGTPSGQVLDVCTGLGYTAISLARCAAVQGVTTIELDDGMVEMQRRNPWSAELFTSPKVSRLKGDATTVLPTLPDGFFSAVVHDPPVQAIAGDLYGQRFYDQLFRVLRPAGRVFHYIGDPDSRASGQLFGGVSVRLQQAGFIRVEVARRAYGVVAVKPG